MSKRGLWDRARQERLFARIVTTDEDAATDGFFWCDGATWETRDFRCVLLAKAKAGQVAAIELRADTPESLAAKMGEAGIDPLPTATIRSHCESAPRSPRKPRARRAPAEGKG